jgi:hypothetical protein
LGFLCGTRGDELQHVRTICDEAHGDAEGLQSASQTPADAGIAEIVNYAAKDVGGGKSKAHGSS